MKLESVFAGAGTRSKRFWGSPASVTAGDTITVALINNMPDAGLRATERQFCAILSAASEGLTVKLDLYSMPGVARGDDAHSHLAAYYDDFRNLENCPPDGIIVTGTEPRHPRLVDEPFWPAFERLAEFAVESKIPVIWSCMAAHAAVFHYNNVARVRLKEKLSGVFESSLSPGRHDVMRCMPSRWKMPQSRLHSLSETALSDAGYTILGRSTQAGADIFVKEAGALHLFFQGHPEYQPASLVGEFRRDVARFLGGQRVGFPGLPRNCFSLDTTRHLSHFRHQAVDRRCPELLAWLDEILTGAAPQDAWTSPACKLYSNWLTYLSEHHVEHAGQENWQRSAALAQPIVDGVLANSAGRAA